MQDEPLDPFDGDPADPGADFDVQLPGEPLSPTERQDVLDDISDLEVYQTLLEPLGIRGLVIDCEDCHEHHFFDWDLLRGNLQHLLDQGRPRLHEPAFDPDPEAYVSWDYARGYADGVHDTLTAEADEQSRES